MNPSMRRLVQLTAVAGTMILALGAGAAAFGDDPAVLAARGIAVHGNEAAITIANLSPTPLRGTVVLRAHTASGELAATAPVSVPGGGSATVTVETPSPIEGGVTVGVVLDDGAPF